MATLEQIVSSIAARVDKPFDVDLQEELKHIINYKRLNYTQQFIEKYPNQRRLFLQKVVAKLEKAPKNDCTPVKDCIILRTECIAPKPIRNSRTIFDFVGDSNFINGYGYQDPSFIQDIGFNRFTKKKPKWYYMNNRIYVYNSTVIDKIGIRGVFENPFQINECSCDKSFCFTETDEYPIAGDLLNSIVRDTLNVEFRQQLLPENQVEVDKIEEIENRGIKLN